MTSAPHTKRHFSKSPISGSTVRWCASLYSESAWRASRPSFLAYHVFSDTGWRIRRAALQRQNDPNALIQSKALVDASLREPVERLHSLTMHWAGSKQHSNAAVDQFGIYIADGGWIRGNAVFHLNVV